MSDNGYQGQTYTIGLAETKSKLEKTKHWFAKHQQALLVTAVGTVSVVGGYILAKSASKPKKTRVIPAFVDADGKEQYSTGLHIVLENVEKNIWRDMDQPEDQYRLEPHAVAWKDAR